MKLSLKDDLLSLLGGEIAVELDTETSPQPVWKAILAVNDANHLQQTLDALVVQVHFEASQVDDGGVTCHTLRIPSGKGTTELAYAFSDGYMVVGSSRDAVAEAVQLHRSGGSLAKSTKFIASLPPGRQMEASALLYEDPLAMAQLSLRSLKPVLPEYLTQHGGDVTPTVIRVYGEEAAIREESINSAFDATGLLIGAAIAIPNLLRSRIAANEASAVGSLRTMTTAQLTYEAMYPTRGYAPYLARLGPDPGNPGIASPEHAGLIDKSLADGSCTIDAWCTKSGFRFQIKAVCRGKTCNDYVVLATPVSNATGTRNFCSTSDG